MRISLPVRFAATIFACIFVVATHGQTNKPSPRLDLPNPTPRPDDLELKYATPPSDKETSKRAVAFRKAQNHEQIQKATDLLLLLSQRLKDDLDTQGKPGATALSLQRAYEIETLAKIVKERMKLQ